MVFLYIAHMHQLKQVFEDMNIRVVSFYLDFPSNWNSSGTGAPWSGGLIRHVISLTASRVEGSIQLSANLFIFYTPSWAKTRREDEKQIKRWGNARPHSEPAPAFSGLHERVEKTGLLEEKKKICFERLKFQIDDRWIFIFFSIRKI